MDSNILERNVYTGLRQGQGPGPIVSYCSSSTPCIGPVPGPVQYTKPLEVTFLLNLFCSNAILAELAE